MTGSTRASAPAGRAGGKSGAKTAGRRVQTRRAGAPDRSATPAAQATACYVYGVLPGDVEVTPEGSGVAGGEIRLVRHGELAALVSELRLSRPLGRPDDLIAHQRLLDDVAAEVPVLPMRFGAVLDGTESVARELLAPHHDEFRAALDDLEGRAQFVVKARYREDAVLREVLAEHPEAARLREQIRGLPEDASWDARIRLGEIINQAIEAKRDADTRALAEGLAPHAVAVVIREPTHEEDAAHLAILVDDERRQEFEEALEDFGRDWAERITLRLIGPQAPYDFVVTGR
ncbi:gas vesicle protein [Sphaerisporangium rufum]|uniref:Gas vesicle protein n=1 Tax=Sphaerisporangium rufum TaxID=1381558 RepID=A0A919R4I7_9ACTN|nr:GvpL/GvpF family gas vesicle protein [Sphaerisporangium rufum]GII79158.1 gas vesicle protein [Sphaerisporangium rufum]